MSKKKREPTLEERKATVINRYDSRIQYLKTDCAQAKADLVSFLRSLRSEADEYILRVEASESMVPLEILAKDQGPWSLEIVSDEMGKCVRFNNRWRKAWEKLEATRKEENLVRYCFGMMEEDEESSN